MADQDDVLAAGGVFGWGETAANRRLQA